MTPFYGLRPPERQNVVRLFPLLPGNVVISFEIVVLSIGWLSTTKSGWLVPRADVAPRILMYAPEPGSPDCVRTSTFGALAASAETMFCGSAARWIIELSTELIT